MRRADREVTAKEDISAIMEKCDAVSVAFAGETPYVIPMSFGFEWTGECPTLYLHGAGEGEKVSRMRRDDRVAFSMYAGTSVVGGATACAYSATYESVCGSGRIAPLSGEEKRHALEVLMRQYAKDRTFTFDDRMLAAVNVWKIDVCQISGKRRT